MRRSAWSWAPSLAAVLASSLALLSCEPGTAPPSASVRIEPSEKALAELFSQECQKKRSLDWVREKVESLRQACWPEGGDCLLRQDGEVAWEAATTKGSTVVVAMSWMPIEDRAGPPSEGVRCGLSVDDGLKPALEAAVGYIRIDGRPLFGPREEDGDLTWHSADGKTQLVLTRYESVAAFEARSRGSDANVEWYKSYLSHHSAHPWELSLR